jgi:hypothetical protein
MAAAASTALLMRRRCEGADFVIMRARAGCWMV